jgi:hypothetical protein
MSNVATTITATPTIETIFAEVNSVSKTGKMKTNLFQFQGSIIRFLVS